jgi:hypothetical protein
MKKFLTAVIGGKRSRSVSSLDGDDYIEEKAPRRKSHQYCTMPEAVERVTLIQILNGPRWEIGR